VQRCIPLPGYGAKIQHGHGSPLFIMNYKSFDDLDSEYQGILLLREYLFQRLKGIRRIEGLYGSFCSTTYDRYLKVMECIACLNVSTECIPTEFKAMNEDELEERLRLYGIEYQQLE